MSKKNVSAIVSGAGWIAGVVDKLVKELHKRGISDEGIHSLVTDDDDVPVEKMADVLAEYFRKSVITSFPITVNYDLTLEDAVKAGHYDEVNLSIASKNFPTERSGKEDCVIELLYLNRSVTNDDALQEIEKRGFRPAELRELLALGEKYPDLQLKFPIVALGSSWRAPGGYLGAPSLYCFGSERELKLYSTAGFWSDSFRFAVVELNSESQTPHKRCIFGADNP